MKITSITQQARDKDRVNVAVDGKYRFSLEIAQLAELGIKVGQEYDETELSRLEGESVFGKLYARALEYCLARPRSSREVSDYLKRKTRPTRSKSGTVRSGVPTEVAYRVLDRLSDRGYVDDKKFADFWVNNRSVVKGASRRKLRYELVQKGIDAPIIDEALDKTERTDTDELRKVIAKKRGRYADEQKFMAYLARLGFSYDDIKRALDE